jgi:hypothetical protein
VTGYGTAVGYVPLRRWIAERHGVPEDHVLVTNGSMQADAFLFDHLVGEGDAVVVEKPTYDRTLLGLRARGADVRMVSLEPDGIDVDELRALLQDGVRPVLAHVIPNFQNPAGYTLSLPKRRALLELAAEHGFVLFEDDPYIAIRFAGEPLPTMLELDEGRGNVVYASSFSKTVCPGIRVGYLVGRPTSSRRSRPAPRTPTSRRTWSPRRSCTGSASTGRLEPGDRPRQGGARRARRAPDRRAGPRAARGDLPGPGGRLLHVGRAAGGHGRRRALLRGGRARGGVRQGHGLPARGRREHAAPRVLRGHRRADRRGVRRLADAYRSLPAAVTQA